MATRVHTGVVVRGWIASGPGLAESGTPSRSTPERDDAETAGESVMAAIARRWIRAFCEECGEQTELDVRPDWVLVCTECSRERRLGENGLLPPSPVSKT